MPDQSKVTTKTIVKVFIPNSSNGEHEVITNPVSVVFYTGDRVCIVVDDTREITTHTSNVIIEKQKFKTIGD